MFLYHEPKKGSLYGFAENGKAAMLANPEYFLWWYSAKSIALVGAIAAVAYLLGKGSR